MRWIVKFIMCALILLVGGCQTLSPHFANAVKQHREDTLAVNQSLVATFQEEMDKDDRSEAKEAYQEIINNLNAISYQSQIIERYIWENLTEDELILVLRTRWRKP